MRIRNRIILIIKLTIITSLISTLMHLQDIVPSNEPLEESSTHFVPVHYDLSLHISSAERNAVTNLRHLQTTGKNNAEECRICLESESEGSKLIKPCKCIGSMEYVHTECLREWIKRRIELNPASKVHCEVCDTQFNYRLEVQRMLECSELTRHYQKQKRGLICFAVTYIILLLLFFAIIALIGVSRSDQDFILYPWFAAHREAIIICIACLLIYGISLLVVAVLFISEYMIKQHLVIGGLANYRENVSLPKNYKIFFRR